MAVKLFESAYNGFSDANGVPLAGGKVYTYQEGTTTAKATYPTRTDAEAATNPNANPVILDSRGTAKIWLAETGLYYFKIDDADDAEVTTIDEFGDEADTNALPLSYLSGLGMSVGTDTDHDVDIATGETRDGADSFDIAVSVALTVAIDASGANGLDTGSVANDTLYAVWVAADSGGTNDPIGLFSTSFSNPTLPSGYDKKRRIGAVLTNGSANIIGFLQSGDYMRLTGDIPTVVSDNTITNDTFETTTVKCPPLALAHIYGALSNSSGTSTQGHLAIRAKDAAELAGDTAENFLQIETSGTFDLLGTGGMVLVNSAQELEYAAEEADGTAAITIKLMGWIDLGVR